MKNKPLLPSHPKKKNNIIKKAVMALVLSCIFLLIVFIPTNTEIYTNTDEISDAINNLQPRIIELDNITIKAQPDSTSCGITSVTVISEFKRETESKKPVSGVMRSCLFDVSFLENFLHALAYHNFLNILLSN